MKSIFVVRNANCNNDSISCTLDLETAIRKATSWYNHLTPAEITTNTVTVERYELDVLEDDNRTASELYAYAWGLENNPFEHDPVEVFDIGKSKVNVLKRFRDKIEEEMVKRYKAAIENDGVIQYKIYIWDDGIIECLEGVQGDNTYLKPHDYESRSLYYVTTIEMPCFDPWDYWEDSVPDDEEEKNNALKSIIDCLVNEYESNIMDVIDDIIFEAEREEIYC